MDVDTDLEELMGYLGEFGKYQRRQFLLHILSALTAGIHMLSLVTVAAVPEHRCLVMGELKNSSFAWNSTEVQAAVPMKDGDKLDSCTLINAHGNGSYPCDSWVYDDTYYKSSIAIEWDFVCHRRWMGSVSQSAYMFGVFTGAVVLGSLADRLGRKKIFYISAVLQLIFGVLVAFIPEFYTFLIIRFLYGIFGSAGSYITGFVLTMELVGASKRTGCGISFQASFAGGLMLVAFWGWLITDRTTLQVVYGLHSLLLIGHWWLIDESPRWLWAHGRQREAVEIVHKALKMNGTDDLMDREKFLTVTKTETRMQEEEGGILGMVRTPNMRKKTLNVCLNWFANSLAYYGLSLNTGTLPGNPFLMLFVTGLVEFPSYISTTFLMDRTGRRSLISTFMIIGGLACIVSAFIPQDTPSGSNTVIAIVMFGKFFIAGSFAIIYNYTAELFPTVVRNTALGVGSMCARLSGALTPLIILLDSLDKTLPIVIFATIAIASGLLSLLLPETLNQPMPQSLEDGERFGVGDTACTSCFKTKRKHYEVPLTTVD